MSRPVASDELLELPEDATSTKLTREFLIQTLGQQKEAVDAVLGVEPE